MVDDSIHSMTWVCPHRIAHGIVSCSELHINASLYRAMGPCGSGASGNSCMLSRDLGAFPAELCVSLPSYRTNHVTSAVCLWIWGD
jgi:hypothetical protein